MTGRETKRIQNRMGKEGEREKKMREGRVRKTGWRRENEGEGRGWKEDIVVCGIHGG